MSLKIMPYKMGSQSAKALAEGLGVKRIRPTFRPKRNTLVVNWGSSASYSHNNVLNLPEAVELAANKLKTFQVLKDSGVKTVAFTSSYSEAKRWHDEGFRIVVRHKLNGNSGEGIEVVEFDGELPRAPLYTKYTKKEREYRVHVFNGEIIDITEKRKRNEAEDLENYNPYIRNLENGWVFCRTYVDCPASVKSESIAAVEALGLDFGAVDIIERNDGDEVFILEINTAPGLQGSTLEKYIEALEQYL